MKNRRTAILFTAIVLIISSLLFLVTFPHWQIRRILNEELPGWFGPGYVIEGPLTIAELESESLDRISTCADCPQVPFGYSNDAWEIFKDSVQDGDEIYYFLSDPASWKHLAGRQGYALVRNGELVRLYITVMS